MPTASPAESVSAVYLSGAGPDVVHFAELYWGTLTMLDYMAKAAIQDLQKQE